MIRLNKNNSLKFEINSQVRFSGTGQDRDNKINLKYNVIRL